MQEALAAFYCGIRKNADKFESVTATGDATGARYYTLVIIRLVERMMTQFRELVTSVTSSDWVSVLLPIRSFNFIISVVRNISDLEPQGI